MTTPTTSVQKAPVDPAIGAAIDVYQRLAVIRNVLAPDLNDQELQLFAMVAERSRLDPFAKQIYAVKRGGRVTFQTGIDGFRSSAEETGEYRGSDEPEFGPDVTEGNFTHPEWARVVVHRQFANGEWLHQPAKAWWTEFYPGSGDIGAMYRKMPKNQLAKCAEAAGFRKAFPKRFADVYTPEEMAQAGAAELAKPVGPTARERIAERRKELEEQQAAGEADDVVDGDVVEVGTVQSIDLVDRLKAAAAAHLSEDNADQVATAEQKAQLRDTFASIDKGVLGRLLGKAFGLEPQASGQFQPSRAEAQALLEVSSEDPEAFVVAAAALANETPAT